MIKEIKGDLLDCEANVIIHCCNCQCIMGAGIAKQIAERYPEAAAVDKKTRSGDETKLGSFSYAKTSDGKTIVNLYGQYGLGHGLRHLDYEAFYSGLEKIANKCHATYMKDGGENIVVGLPKLIGCGLAGGNWSIVKAMIERVFKDEAYPVLIVEWNKN
jgi:O-acetyl-ADP-ribose deacetylase (regulator of RNase III)